MSEGINYNLMARLNGSEQYTSSPQTAEQIPAVGEYVVLLDGDAHLGVVAVVHPAFPGAMVDVYANQIDGFEVRLSAGFE